jgi:hypothetical protein
MIQPWRWPLRAARAFARQVRYFFIHLIDGDQGCGTLRAIGAMVMVAAFFLVSVPIEPIASPSWLLQFLKFTSLVNVIPENLHGMLDLLGKALSLQALRHLAPPALGVLIPLWVGARYLQDLFELKRARLGFNYLMASVFAHNYPHLTIKDGVASVEKPDSNPMLNIGGPGWVDIKLGSAALFERVGAPSSVAGETDGTSGAGTHFLRRFETLREAFDLREIEMTLSNVSVTTKDGLPLLMPELRARFRLRGRLRRTETQPYPVSVRALRQACYNRAVQAQGLEPWPEMVMGAVRATIAIWAAHQRMADLIPAPPNMVFEPPLAPVPPPDQDDPSTSPAPVTSTQWFAKTAEDRQIDAAYPDSVTDYRQQINNFFRQPQVRQRFADMGAEIIWVGVGHLRPDPQAESDLRDDLKVSAQQNRILWQLAETWKAGQNEIPLNAINRELAFGRWLAERASAEAHVEMIMALTHDLDEAHHKGMPMADEITRRLIEYASGYTVGGKLRQLPEIEFARRAWVLQRMVELGGNLPTGFNLLTGE